MSVFPGGGSFVPTADVEKDPRLKQPLTGASRVEYAAGDDSRVVLRDVEMFQVMDDGPLGKVTSSDLDKIVLATNERMSFHAYPQVIVTHDERAEVIGRIPGPLTIRESDVSGKPTVFGDIEMRAADFECYVGSGRFPRRSAEIDRDSLAMVQLSLLGRQQPAVTLPDLVFGKTTRRPIFGIASESEIGFSALQDSRKTESAPDKGKIACGAVDASVASARHSKEQTMTIDEALAQIRSSMAQVTGADRAEFKKRMSAMFEESDDDDKKKKEDMAKHADPKPPVQTTAPDADTAKFALITSKVAELESRLAKTEGEYASFRAQATDRIVEMTWKQRLDALKTQGFKLDIEREMKTMKALASDDARADHLKHIETYYAREATPEAMIFGGMLPMQSARTGKVDFSKEMRDRAIEMVTAARDSGDAKFSFDDAVRKLTGSPS